MSAPYRMVRGAAWSFSQHEAERSHRKQPERRLPELWRPRELLGLLRWWGMGPCPAPVRGATGRSAPSGMPYKIRF